MYLSDTNIAMEIEKKNLLFEPFIKDSLTSNGYDLKIEVDMTSPYLKEQMKTYPLQPNELIKVKSIETIGLGPDIIGFMYLRSRYTRQGLIGIFAVVDAGFHGKIIATIKNLSNVPVDINLSEGVIHIVFSYLKDRATTPYGSTEKSHFQNQK